MKLLLVLVRKKHCRWQCGFTAFAVGILLAANGCMAQQPVAYYPFDNDVLDKSGHNNHGNIRGTVSPVADRFGNPCGAMHFDGRTGYVEVSSSASLERPIAAISICVWYQLPSNGLPAKWLTAVCKGRGSSEVLNPQYRLQVQQTPNLTSYVCTNSYGSSTISLSTGFTKCDNDFTQHLFETGKWGFYALVYDGSSVSAYMNGAKVFEQSHTGPLVANQDPLYIGLDEPGLTEYFEGDMDDLRIYATALTATEVQQLYNEQRPAMFDAEEFVLELPPSRTIYLPANSCSTQASFAPPNVQSLCGPVSLRQTLGPAAGSLVSCGKHWISYTAVATSGYTQSCSFYLTVQDTVRPVIQVPRDTVLYVQKGSKGIAHKYTAPLATDNCTLAFCKLQAGKQSGDFFGLGTHKIIYRAADIYGNRAEKAFMVTVKELAVSPPIIVDTTKPIVVAPPTPAPTPPTVAPPPPPVPSRPITPPMKVDSPITAKGIDFGQREILKTRVIEVSDTLLQIELYDNAEIDQDSISLFLNKQVILENQVLSAQPLKLAVRIDTLIDNELSLYAENLGSIPPNTALMILYDGTVRHEIHLSSTLTSSGTVVIRRKKKT